MDKYKVQSYKLQDGRWGSSFVPPLLVSQNTVTLSEPVEFGKYFSSKEEADKFSIDYIKENLGISDNIEIS